MNMIIDSTLREGAQTPGVCFSTAEKRSIVDQLVGVGVGEMELGISSPRAESPSSILAYCRSNYPDIICSLWARCRPEDIRYAAGLKPDMLSLSIPASDILLEKKIEKTRDWALHHLLASVDLAKNLGLPCGVGVEDATRADPIFLRQLISVAGQHGVQRIRLADTLGIASPGEIGRLVAEVVAVSGDAQVGVHCHNDFGMATANAVSALENGADCVDATILGLGERSGCTRLEEVVCYLKLKKNAAFNVDDIPALARYVARITGRQIDVNRPFLGKDIFTCETGLHLYALQNDPATYEPYVPELLGAKRTFIFGRKAGRKAVVKYLGNSSAGDSEC